MVLAHDDTPPLCRMETTRRAWLALVYVLPSGEVCIERHSPSSHPAKLAWGLLRSDPLQPNRHLVYAIPQSDADVANYADQLAAAWHWTGGTRPSICPAGLPDTDVAESVRCWHEDVAPVSAEVLEGLYCLDGQWECVGKTRAEHGGYTDAWAQAACRIAKAWLAFYDRSDAPCDRQHQVNRAKLQRIYTLTLIGLAQVRMPGGDLQRAEDDAEALEVAIDTWLTVCRDDRQAWLFDDRWWTGPSTTPTGGLAEREQRREQEVQRVVKGISNLLARLVTDSSQGVGSQGASTLGKTPLPSALRGQFEVLGLRWFLPRYDVAHAWAVIAQAQGRRWPKDVTLGFTRLLAGVVVGLSLFVFQGDTWYALIALANGWRLWVAVVVVVAVIYVHLHTGIRRYVPLPSRTVARRALVLVGIGESWALILSYAAQLWLMPFIHLKVVGTDTRPLSVPLWAPLLLAQLALFIGVFTQLLFHERPTTIPLDAP